nr:integrase DNA-binding domain-containing protein [uncultured Mediterraneibacter sp.]
MANSRKDSKGRVLRTGEAVRSNGLYQYSYTDPYGKRRYICENVGETSTERR